MRQFIHQRSQYLLPIEIRCRIRGSWSSPDIVDQVRDFEIPRTLTKNIFILSHTYLRRNNIFEYVDVNARARSRALIVAALARD